MGRACALCLWLWVALRGAGGALLPLDAERLSASVGGFAVMNCHLDFPFGHEIPYHLQWDKDGESIYSWYSGAGEGASARVADRWGGRITRVADGRAGLGRAAINVSAVRETDAGLYRCRVTFPNRTPSARNDGVYYRLEVEGGNLIATPPTNVTVLEGERAELECAPKSRDSTVQWYRDGEPLEATPELAARAEIAPGGALVLRRAAAADLGEYSCRVRDAAGNSQSAAAFLDVQYKAKVVHAPEERRLPLGRPASLDCHFSANPPLTNLRWEKDGFLFDPYNVPGVFYSRNGSLLFNRVDESHEGLYSCTPYNALGTAGASPRVRVRVRRPPALAVRPLPLYAARLGGEVTLPCAAAGDAALAWSRRDGAPLPPGRHRLDGGNLTVAPVAEEDRGVYVCSATDETGAAAADAELLVENVPPRAPRLLSAAPAPRAVRVAWAPASAGPEPDYAVWYRERAAPDWRSMRILSRGVTEATLTGLRPATDYEVRVLAEDHIGDGLFSKPIFVRTAEGAPEEPQDAEPLGGAPEEGADELAVTVRLVEDGALVQWQGAPPARCELRWLEGDRLLVAAHTHHDYFFVKEVSEGAQYTARVSCGSARGVGGVSVPQYTRLRAAAAACAGAALLLAAAGAALFAARRRLASHASPKRR